VILADQEHINTFLPALVSISSCFFVRGPIVSSPTLCHVATLIAGQPDPLRWLGSVAASLLGVIPTTDCSHDVSRSLRFAFSSSCTPCNLIKLSAAVPFVVASSKDRLNRLTTGTCIPASLHSLRLRNLSNDANDGTPHQSTRNPL